MSTDDAPLGVNGERALAAERSRRRELERRLSHTRSALRLLAREIEQLDADLADVPTKRRKWGKR